MKKLIWIIATLALATWLALLAKDDPGYVLINVKGHIIESSLVFTLLLVVLFSIAVHLSWRAYSNVKSVGRDYRIWRSRRSTDKANESLVRGLLEISEGKWQEAEKNVLKHAAQSNTALLNYLAAARAAQEQGAYDRRDLYLKDARQTMPANDTSADIAVGLTQAQLQLDQNQLEQALATLRHLQQLAPKHNHVLKTLTKLYVDLADWEHLVELLPTLRKRKIYADAYIDDIEKRAYSSLLNQSVSGGQKTLQEMWYRLPQSLQEQESILVSYVGHLINVNASDIAEPLIRIALKKYWSESLARYYGLINGADSKAQLAFAESWLRTHENNAVVLLTLGRLCLRNGLWGKAQSYLEASIGAGQLPEAYNELGNLLEKMGEPEKAIQCYRQGLVNAPGCEITIATGVANASELENKTGKPQLLPNTPIAAQS
ncbi:heme biosynthesis HemY N-terminal domain-containing protein [Kaarinaea lacus]